MSLSPEQQAAIDAVSQRTEHLKRVQDLAQSAISDAGLLRAQAVKDALAVFSVKELAEVMGVTAQRIYTLAREAR